MSEWCCWPHCHIERLWRHVEPASIQHQLPPPEVLTQPAWTTQMALSPYPKTPLELPLRGFLEETLRFCLRDLSRDCPHCPVPEGRGSPEDTSRGRQDGSVIRLLGEVPRARRVGVALVGVVILEHSPLPGTQPPFWEYSPLSGNAAPPPPWRPHQNLSNQIQLGLKPDRRCAFSHHAWW